MAGNFDETLYSLTGCFSSCKLLVEVSSSSLSGKETSYSLVTEVWSGNVKRLSLLQGRAGQVWLIEGVNA